MKKGLKQLLALGLTIVMAVPLAACGGKEQTGTGAAVQKEFVYVPEYVQIDGDDWIDNICADGKGFYYSASSFDEETGVSKSVVKYFDAETKEVTEVVLDFPTAESEETGSSNIQNIALLDNHQTLAVLESCYEVINEETWEGINHLTLRFFQLADGTQTAEADVTDVIEGGYAQAMTADKDGNVYISNGDTGIWVFDKTGKKLFDISVDSGWVQNMGETREGQVVYTAYSQTSSKMEMHVIDPAVRGISKTCKENVPDSWSNGVLSPAWDKGVLLNSNSGLVIYDVEAEKSEPVLDWLDSDISRDHIRAYAPLDDGRLLAVSHNFNEEKSSSEVIFLTKTPSSELPQKEILTLAAIYVDQNISDAVIQFNKSHDTYRIQVINYGDNVNGEEWEDTLLRFNNDLTSGRGADLFDLNSLNIKMLSQKGVLEDLYPYLDKDSDVKREDFFESVLKSFTENGKLYCIPNSVYINTLIGKASEVGNTPGWTLDDVMALLASKPEGTELLDYASKESILQMMLMFSLDSFVNWETGECKLDSEEFIKVLELANTFPKEVNYSEEEESVPSKIQSGKMLLLSTSFSSVQDYQMYSAMFGEPVTAIGYPTPEGTGSCLSGQNMIAINAGSKNKEAAWEFLKSLLTEEYFEKGNIWGIPTRISAYDKKNDEYMTPEYYEDENGNQVEQSKGGWGWDDFNIELYAATQEEVDALTALVNTCDRSYSYDTQLFKIVSEEAQPFFEGQKTAKEAADIIQSRVKMYVSENR